MAEYQTTTLNSRLDFVKFLKVNDNNISQTIVKLEEHFELDDQKKDSLHGILFRLRDVVKRSKKSIDSLKGEWWISPLYSDSELNLKRKRLCSEDNSGISSVHHRKNISDLSLKQQRSRLSIVLDSIRELAEIENTTEVKIAAMALQLISNQSDTRQVAKVSKLIATDSFPGDFGKVFNKCVDVDKTLFLLDMLEIGKRKYTKLRQHLLSSNIEFPAYQKVAEYRNDIILRSSIHLYPNPSAPIGVCVPYAKYVEHTFIRILANLSPLVEDFPLTFQIADGLDGSGSHTIYNHQNTNTSTKSYILFCFKPVVIKSSTGKELWRNTIPNSPFCQRPVFLCAAKENQENIKQFMDDIINPDKDRMKNEGFAMPNMGHISVDIIRSMFDGKMSGILSGAAGASCQLCTATKEQLKDVELITQGFPINRHISDAIELFEELEDKETFFKEPSNDRINLTHEPISTINITPASPLHSYTCIFRWFNLLVYHLNCHKLKWSPTSADIRQSMIYVRNLVQEKTGLKVDQPDPSGGTTSTGNIARRAFSNESKFIECVSSVVEEQHKEALTVLHTQLSAILRIFNCDRKIHTSELGKLCKSTYLLILESFPWANITPTLHKLLAHSEELLREINFGYGFKCFSEEGSEACNKLIRKYREHLARKTSFEDNISDIFIRLASESDPGLLEFRSKLRCERCGEEGHTRRTAKCCSKYDSKDNMQTSIDSLVHSIIVK